MFRAHSQMESLAIRKKSWNTLLVNYPQFAESLKLKFLDHYDRCIRRPLLKKRFKEIHKTMLRKDYDQFLVVDEDSEEGFFIRAERWRIFTDPKK